MLFFYYELATTIGTLLLIIWIFVRITHPFACTCGYRTWFAAAFRRHILMGHKWSEQHR
jgi:hypothetical protein